MIKTLRLRLTLWHAFFFGLSALFVFLIAYYMVSNQLLHEVDSDLQDTVQEFAERLKIGGIDALKIEIDSETESHGDDAFFARFLDQKRQLKIEQLSPKWKLSIPKIDTNKLGLQWSDLDTDLDGGPVRLLTLAVPGFGWIEIGMSLADYDLRMEKMSTVFALSMSVMVVIGVFAGWLQLKSVFQSMESVRYTAISISEGDLSSRVEAGSRGKELSDLTNSFNTMLDRIQSLLEEMRDVSDHVAHDLRTPVSRIRGLAETCITTHHKSLRSQVLRQTETLGIIVEESDQLGEMINTMLDISQTDAGLINQQRESVDLTLILREAYELFQPVAKDAGIIFSITQSDQCLTVEGDRTRLQRAISNLIDNALKFTSLDGHVSLSSGINNDLLYVCVRDTGVGIAKADMEHIFDRFYRSDYSRSKPGNGLGLSYAKSIICSHGGDILVESYIGKGSKFTISLPLKRIDLLPNGHVAASL